MQQKLNTPTTAITSVHDIEVESVQFRKKSQTSSQDVLPNEDKKSQRDGSCKRLGNLQ